MQEEMIFCDLCAHSRLCEWILWCIICISNCAKMFLVGIFDSNCAVMKVLGVCVLAACEYVLCQSQSKMVLQTVVRHPDNVHIMGVVIQASLPFPFSQDNVKLSPFRRCHFKQLTPPWLGKQQDAGKSGWSATAASYSCSSVHHRHISCLKDIFASWCGTAPRTEPLLN